MLTHVVLMKFTDPADATEAQVRLEALVGNVPPIPTMVVELDTLHTETSYDLLMTTTHATRLSTGDNSTVPRINGRMTRLSRSRPSQLPAS